MPCRWEFKIVQPLYETVWQFLKRLKIELYETTVPLLGVCVYLSLSLSLYIYKLIEIKVLNLYTHIHGSIIHNSQKKEVTHKSFDR